MRSTTIIAEVGINHNKSLVNALKLCDVAKECGADVIKTQLESPSAYTLTYDETLKVYEHCSAIGMKFACTAFDVPTLRWLLENTEMAFVKIASCDSGNLPLLRAAEKSGLPVMQSIKTIPATRKAWTYLFVVPEYPTPLQHCNLQRVSEPWCSGLSDHSGNPLIPALAVVLGAEIIECHIKLNDTDEGPDMSSSLNPEQFKQMVNYVRQAEQAYGASVSQRCVLRL